MIAVLASVFGAALLASPHCAAMCGGFVCFYSRPDGARAHAAWLPHAAYNGGRLVSYALLGALAGAFGAGLDRAGAGAGLTRVAAIVSGSLLIAWGGLALARAAGIRIPRLAHAPFAHPGVARTLRAVGAAPPAARGLVLGLVTTLLPCGLLYAFVAASAASGSAPAGAAMMAAFWLGTLPVMAGLGVMVRGLLGASERRAPVLTSAVLLVMGVLTVLGKLHLAPSLTAAGSHVCR